MLALSRTRRPARLLASSSRPLALRRFESLTSSEIFDTSLPDVRPHALRNDPPRRPLPPTRKKKPSPDPLSVYDVPQSDDPFRRPERRSPAAVFGARKMPRISLPSELENKLERLVGQQDMALTRRCFQLFLPPPPTRARNPQALPPPKKSASTNLVPLSPAKRNVTSPQGRVLDLSLQPLKAMPRETTRELVVAHAAAELPTQYAVLRTLMREVQARNGWDTPETQGGIQIVDFAAGYGHTAWAAAATLPSPAGRKNHLVLIEPSPIVGDLSRELLRLDTPGPLASWPIIHFRSLHKYRSAGGAPAVRPDKSVGVLAFALASLRTPSERRRKLRELWHSGVETLVVAEQAHRDGWTVVEEAREFLLGLGREELEGAKLQAGEWTPPEPEPEPVEPKTDETTSTTPANPALAPRTRGRRRPGELLRPRAPTSTEVADTDADSTYRFGIDPSPPVPAKEPKREKFVFHGVEFEAEVAQVPVLSDGSSHHNGGRRWESPSGDVAKWDAEGKALVRDGRVMGCHVVAPCPHDHKCPLASTPTPCSFGQLLETPTVTRLTKNTKSDLTRLSFSYLILRRGARPEVTDEDRGAGREGEVAREERLAKEAKEGRVALEGEDGVFALPEAAEEEGEGGEAREQVDYGKLRKEIGEWGRVLKAPLHRKGHSEVDLCSADGSIKRSTFSKRLGKQVWYDTANIQEGDAFPHKPTTAVVRDRGVTHLTPMHKTNKVSIRNSVVSGLEKLSFVEYKEVRDMMGAMGVEIPEFDNGKRPKNKRWVVEYSDEVEASAGWEAARKVDRRIDPRAKDQLVKGILGGEEDFEGVTFDRAADDDSGLRQTRLVDQEAARAAAEAAASGGAEFEPTPLVGAREVVVPDPHVARAFPVTASLSADGPPSLLGDIIASQHDGRADAGFSIAASTKVSLAGLGEGWMEEYSADVSPADRRAAARDRSKTFESMGIVVPDLGRPRTLKDDWELLEKWDGVAERPPKPKHNAFWNRRDWRARKRPSSSSSSSSGSSSNPGGSGGAGGPTPRG